MNKYMVLVLISVKIFNIKLWHSDNIGIYRDRPAAIPVEVKSIDDTSNFDEFPDIDLKWRKYL